MITALLSTMVGCYVVLAFGFRASRAVLYSLDTLYHRNNSESLLKTSCMMFAAIFAALVNLDATNTFAKFPKLHFAEYTEQSAESMPNSGSELTPVHL